MAAHPAPLPQVIGVVGAGTMGMGIAQLAAQTGARALVHDPVAGALEEGIAGLRHTLDGLAARGKIGEQEAAGLIERVEPVTSLEGLAGCGLVIEAAPERLELKARLLDDLMAVVSADAILATNTSSLSVTELAAETSAPARVVGMHFFNPAPVMGLVEVVPGEDSSPHALSVVRAVGEAMGKRVIEARDAPGFLVNRVNRPFSLESLKVVEEGLATVEQVDRICRMAGGFRMGPFELMDLIGIDTNHAVATAFQRQSFGEPRYRPSPLAARKVAAGRLGRKTGRGWYAYAEGDDRAPDPATPEAGGGDGRAVAIRGTGALVTEIGDAAAAAGFELVDSPDGDRWLTIGCDGPGERDGPRMMLLDRGSLHALDPEAVGFHAVPPMSACRLIELTSTPRTDRVAWDRAGEFAAALGCVSEHVGDSPGLVLGRILSQVINEAAFAVDEGDGTIDDVDAGMRLGVNHPRGPFAWSELIGPERVADTLAALQRELGEPRYRAARRLREARNLGRG